MHQEGFAAGFSAAELMGSAHGSDSLQTVQIGRENATNSLLQSGMDWERQPNGSTWSNCTERYSKSSMKQELSSALLQDIFATRVEGKYLFDLSWGIESSIFNISSQLKQKGKKSSL